MTDNELRSARLEAFDDDELQELLNGCVTRHDQQALPPAILERAGRLATELSREVRRRRGRYRGPGVYVATKNGAEHEVYGLLDCLINVPTMVVIRADPASDQLTTISIKIFEQSRPDGLPSYEWARPLPGQEER